MIFSHRFHLHHRPCSQLETNLQTSQAAGFLRWGVEQSLKCSLASSAETPFAKKYFPVRELFIYRQPTTVTDCLVCCVFWFPELPLTESRLDEQELAADKISFRIKSREAVEWNLSSTTQKPNQGVSEASRSPPEYKTPVETGLHPPAFVNKRSR